MRLRVAFYKALGKTPDQLNVMLEKAVREKKPGRVSDLLLAGADSNHKTKDGIPLLALAGSTGHLKTLKALCQKDTDFSLTDSADRTGLIWAIRNNHTEAADFLIDKMTQAGIGVDQIAKDGSSAFIAAMIARNEQIIDKLLLVRANPDVQDNEGMTPMMWAVRIKRPDLALKILHAGADPDIQDKDGRTALMQAADKGRVDFLDMLLEHNADINKKDHRGQTALMAWIRSKDTEDDLTFLDKLIAARVTVTQKDAAGTVTGFQEQTLDLNAQDKNGETALMHAIRRGRRDVVQKLLVAGASVHIKANDDVTALMVAARSGDTGIISDLLAAGANPHDVTTSGLTARMWSAAFYKHDAYKLLEQAEKDVPPSLPKENFRAPNPKG